MKYLLTCLVMLTALLSTAVMSDENTPEVEITSAWARPTANTRTPGGVFLTLTNHGREAVTLTGAKSDIARMAHLHHTGNKGGMMTMDMVDTLVIEAGKSVRFAPGGHHIMLMGLSEKLTKGITFNLTLTFKEADELTVSVEVTGMMGPSAKDVP